MSLPPGSLLTQDLDDDLLYVMDWEPFLNGEYTIATSTWTVTEAGGATDLTLSDASIQDGNLKTQVLATGGTVGKKYRLHNEVTLSGSPTQTVERSFYLRVAQR
jgi:hypothetical protein